MVADDAVAALSEQIDLSAYGKEAMLILAVNPLPYPISRIMKVSIATPKNDAIWSFTSRDSKGNAVAIQEIARDTKDYPVHDAEARPWPYATHRHLCYLELSLPAMGYEVIEILPSQHFHPEHYYWLPMRRATTDNILRADNVLENEHLRAEVQPNGTICLTHKASKRTYRDLHYFEDAGDVGNYWAYYPPYHNQIHTTRSAAPKIWVEDNGPLYATLAVEYTWELPTHSYESRKGVEGKGRRSSNMYYVDSL